MVSTPGGRGYTQTFLFYYFCVARTALLGTMVLKKTKTNKQQQKRTQLPTWERPDFWLLVKPRTVWPAWAVNAGVSVAGGGVRCLPLCDGHIVLLFSTVPTLPAANTEACCQLPFAAAPGMLFPCSKVEVNKIYFYIHVSIKSGKIKLG